MTAFFETLKTFSITALLAGAFMLSTTACQQQYEPDKSSSSNGLSVDTATQPIYRSYKFYSTTVGTPATAATGVDFMHATDQTVTAGFKSIGVEMNLLLNTSETRTQLFQCAGQNPNGQPVHTVVKTSMCPNGTNGTPLGYVENNAIGAALVAVYLCDGADGSFYVSDVTAGTTTLYSTNNGLMTTYPETCLGTGPKVLVGYTL